MKLHLVILTISTIGFACSFGTMMYLNYKEYIRIKEATIGVIDINTKLAQNMKEMCKVTAEQRSIAQSQLEIMMHKTSEEKNDKDQTIKDRERMLLRLEKMSSLIKKGNEINSDPIYVHFKNNRYIVKEIAKDTETQEMVVIYRSVDEECAFSHVRSLEMLLSPVDKEKYPDCPFENRFMTMEEWLEVVNNNPDAINYGKGAGWYNVN